MHYSTEEVAFATQLGLYKEGKRNVACLVKNVTESFWSTDLLRNMQDEQSSKQTTKMSHLKALVSIIDNRLTKYQNI